MTPEETLEAAIASLCAHPNSSEEYAAGMSGAIADYVEGGPIGGTIYAEYATFADFPDPGVLNKITVALDTGVSYRWDGDSYEPLASAPQVAHDETAGIDAGDIKHLSAAQKTDLTDGGDTSLHFHSADRAFATAEVVAHVALPDPHTQYLKESEASTTYATKTELGDHVGDTTAAHAASAISFSPVGGLAATTAQAAIAELDSEKQANIPTGTALQYYRGDKVWATLDKAVVGLGNVDNTSDADKPISTATQTALNDKAPLNTTLAANAGSSTPPTTASGSLVSKLQALRDNVVYILANWLQLGETSATAYRGDRGKTAYDHSQTAHAPANADNTQATLNAGASKTTPVDADTLAMLDSAASNSIKKLTWTNVKATLKAYLDGVYEPKLTAGDTAKYYRGDKTWQDLAGAVRSTVLTGLASGTNAAIAATDTLLGGLAKLQAQLNSKQSLLTFDSAPTDGSSNPVTSNGVYDALLGKSANGHTHDSITTNAGDASTPVYFSGGKPVVCTSLDLSTTGNAATATKLSTARTIALTRDVTGSGNFDGSGNLSITASVADNSHLHTTTNVTGLDTALAGKAPLEMGANSWTTITNGATATWVDGFSLTCPIASGVNNYANQTLEVWCVYGESASLQHMTSIHLHLCAKGTTVTYRAQAEGSYALGEIYARFDNGGTIAYLTPEIHLPANAKLFVRRARGYGTAGAGFNTTYQTISTPISYAWAIDRTGDYRVVSRPYVSGQGHYAGTIYLEY